jgi:hypothetical protein
MRRARRIRSHAEIAAVAIHLDFTLLEAALPGCRTLLALSLEGRFQGCGFFHEQPRTHPTVVIPSAEAREICF